ncbi:hypothetical protein PHYBLDRAFT_173853 [Phycomyces blakesleeanus NRRL 1555(-)]|uniref:Uncharacterized protein n=1 Tax=Phycomyces blakesleeanus (strain ATCC 8743b / DSM 1359 / FGSC 10004 / NBRC 33097 / NRRL 1555) TaxID=763407 RepID=A0A162ZMY5_PHYB8|nr:hypothetical protein PHYBLDRAFT_173853 [Phycomyces blakesleeanus NRRL 1555(-)]OAD67941.1 hypothetical protein PHYBLDRAFT_173853 [Phycomyces blakesleeanus NRRL 1555(-)]|eukprot:XP_018285981.1 hypothetical protein PHYBLDRAFT_173853 [Phycomyces blakesleeanus NRRL 1555(-)]
MIETQLFFVSANCNVSDLQENQYKNLLKLVELYFVIARFLFLNTVQGPSLGGCACSIAICLLPKFRQFKEKRFIFLISSHFVKRIIKHAILYNSIEAFCIKFIFAKVDTLQSLGVLINSFAEFNFFQKLKHLDGSHRRYMKIFILKRKVM